MRLTAEELQEARRTVTMAVLSGKDGEGRHVFELKLWDVQPASGGDPRWVYKMMQTSLNRQIMAWHKHGYRVVVTEGRQ